MAKCCNDDCCPPTSDYLYYEANDKQGWPEWEVIIKAEGDYLKGEHSGKCCPCKWDLEGNDCPAATPHRVPNAEVKMDRPGSGREYTFTKTICKCECNEELVQQRLNYSIDSCGDKEPYGKDADGNDIYQWRCADATPDWDASTCSCKCDTQESDCTGGTPSYDAAICSCYCDIERQVCKAQKAGRNVSADDFCTEESAPSFDAATCSCVCTVDPSSCVAPEKFDADKCECNCGITCDDPAEPDMDVVSCECYCALANRNPPCPLGQVFDADTCSCGNCNPPSCPGCQTHDLNCKCVGCEDCTDTKHDYGVFPDNSYICCAQGTNFCMNRAGVAACYDTNCPVGQYFSYGDCACKCENRQKVICGGKCKDRCPPGESFDANCKCYDSSLLSIELVP